MRIARALLVLVAVCLPACYAPAGSRSQGRQNDRMRRPPIIVTAAICSGPRAERMASLSADLVDLEKTIAPTGRSAPAVVEIGPGGRVRSSGPAPARQAVGAGSSRSATPISTAGCSLPRPRPGGILGFLVRPCKMFAPTMDSIAQVRRQNSRSVQWTWMRTRPW